MNVLQQLNSVQRKVVESAAGPTLVLAGAGSGKTRVLTHRIAYLISSQQASPEQILAVTFTNKAASEMRERLIKLLGQPVVNSVWRQNTGPMIGTFHSVCARILREDIAALGLGYTPSFTIYDQSDQLRAIRQILKEQHISTQEFSPKAILGMIGRAKIELLSPGKFRERQSEQSPIYKVAAQVYERYQKFLIGSNALDFSDLLFRTVELWQNQEQILKKHQSRWPFVLVDEYQDTNQTQYTFCQLLTKAKRNLFVVGDDCQSIYGFRGANLENILNFTKDYPKANKFLLEQNYRSTKSILDLANAIIKKNKRQQIKTLWTDNNAGIPPQLVEVDDEVAEAEFVLQEIGRSASLDTQNSELEAEDVEYEYDEEDRDDDVPFTGTGILDRVMAVNRGRHGYGEAVNPVKINRDLSSQVNLNDYVVLYRTNAQSRALEEVMLRWGVPYQIIGGVRFYDRKEIKDVIAYLRVLHNPRDLVSLERIINTPIRGIGPKTWQEFLILANNHDFDFKRIVSFLRLQELSGTYKKVLPFCQMMHGLTEGLSALSVSEIIKKVVTQSGYLNHLKKTEVNFQEREENIKELQTVAERFAEDSEDQALTEFLEEVALVSDIDRLENNQNSLTLMTVHAAKGLEFPHVFIVGMEQGLFPHSSSLMNPAELEEERRLCYVGITRAREQLHMIHTRQRHLYGSTIFPEPSEFIVDLKDDVVERRNI